MTLEEARNILIKNKILFPLSKGSVGFKPNPFYVRRGSSLEEELQKYPELYNFLLTFPSIKEGLYRCYHLIEKVPTCKFCGKDLYFSKKEYSRTCGSQECINKLNFETKVKNNPEDPFNTKKAKETAKNRTKEQKEATRLKTKQTCLEKYGVENPSQSEKIKERTKRVCLEKYGVTNVSYNPETIEKRKQTNLEHCGATSVFKTDSFKESLKKYNLERYGVEHVGQAEEVKAKMKQTCQEKYGVDYSFQADITKEHIRQTNLERYGVECATQNKEIKDKTKKTCLEKYGFEYATQSAEVKEKTKNTLAKRVEENPNYWQDIRNKSFETLREKYGSLEEYYRIAGAKAKETLIKSYGSMENLYKIRGQKTKEKYLRELGVSNYRNTEEFKERYQKERDSQYKLFRENNPFVIPLEELENSLLTFFEEHGISDYRKEILIREGVASLGYDVHSFNFGNGDNSKKFPGIEVKEYSLENFLPVLEEKLRELFKEFLSDSYRSKGEKELFDYVDSLIGEGVFFQNRSLVKTIDGKKMEIDIYIPARKIAIEYNGCYWHNIDRTGDPNYHLNKTLACEKQGIRLIHIWDYEWAYEREKVQNFLKGILCPKVKIGARKCTVRKLFQNEEKQFLNSYHLQGYKKSEVCYGLIYNNEIVQLMSFTLSRYRKGIQYELLRLCTKEGYTIIGGAEKLFSIFLKEYNPSSVISYCNRNKFRGDVYSRLGFKGEKLKPDVFYVKFLKDSFQKFTANSLARIGADKLIGTDEGKGTNNEEIVKKEGYFKMYGVGQQAYIWEKKP
jgi:hypothetical protein